MNRTTELAEFLDIALRGRIESVAELAEVTGGSMDATEKTVARLEEFGFLSLADGVITYRRPDATVADVTQHILADVARDLESGIARTQGILQSLPKLLQAWEHGDSDVHGLPIDVMHGPFAAPDMYKIQASRSKPVASYACMPDTVPLYTVLAEKKPGSYWEENGGPNHDIRLIVSTVDANTELVRNQITHEINAGSQVRMHPNPPSFFWILDHTSVGIPFNWGEAWPSSMMSIQSPTLAGIMTWIYHRVWDEAVPVADHGHSWENPWDPILKLMNSGLTMESASIALGLTPRTGRRRVADAMRHYGVSSQFSLGAAWSASRGQ
ncbi:helix-turn-helix transcriptional regulator [Rhodococcus sp. 24CO]|uniref:helix-turn-helix transcriptional regulator n=1 Tax=Rhodococcus sp. 24CO TaxID=3117460 RepID=UPI003D33F5F9